MAADYVGHKHILLHPQRRQRQGVGRRPQFLSRAQCRVGPRARPGAHPDGQPARLPRHGSLAEVQRRREQTPRHRDVINGHRPQVRAPVVGVVERELEVVRPVGRVAARHEPPLVGERRAQTGPGRRGRQHQQQSDHQTE